MQENSLWELVGNKCLELASEILDRETAPTAATVETVTKLVETAIQIDVLNLRWEEYSKSGLRDPLVRISHPSHKYGEADKKALADTIREILTEQASNGFKVSYT